jgi:hypothetical protein
VEGGRYDDFEFRKDQYSASACQYWIIPSIIRNRHDHTADANRPERERSAEFRVSLFGSTAKPQMALDFSEGIVAAVKILSVLYLLDGIYWTPTVSSRSHPFLATAVLH